MNYHNLVIAPLNAFHDRKGFHCNVETLDHYIHRQAGQDIKRRISRVFIASLPGSPKTVIGYYSLSTLSIELSKLPEKLALKLPKHPIPAALVGRLAVSKDARKSGIGKMLLADAVKRTLSISEQIGIYAMVVDAIDDNAEKFYEQFGFTRLSDDSPRLFLPLKSFE
ncbi:MAG: GNAT family N-acetyltransferase [Desulfobacula sp.]|nr:GNAT family N-acetyltransferase [Desulfobacula sp.]